MIWKTSLPVALAVAVAAPVLAQTIALDTRRDETPPVLEVEDGARVTVEVAKRLGEACEITTKRAELPPEPDALSILLSAVVLGFRAASTDPLPACQPLRPDTNNPLGTIPPRPAAFARAAEIENRLLALERTLAALRDDLKNVTGGLTAVQQTATQLASCAKSSAQEPCDDDGRYDEKLKELRSQLTTLLGTPLPSTDIAARELAATSRIVEGAWADLPTADPERSSWRAWLEWAGKAIRCLDASIDALDHDAETARPRLAKLPELEARVRGLEARWQVSKELLADREAKVSGEAVCKNAITGQPTVTIPFSVVYRSEPRFAVTAGVLYTSLGARQIKTEPTRVEAAPGFEVRIAETDRRSDQVLPFTFLTYRLGGRGAGASAWGLHLTAGLGVNDNTGRSDVEYFFGPSVSRGKVHLHLGVHRGRTVGPANGFELGQIAPTGLPSVPVERDWSTRWSIALAYRVLK